MGLTILGNGPVGGTLARGQTLAQVILGMPGLVGAWAADAMPSGAVSSWAAEVGTGVLTQSNAPRQPTFGVVNGVRAAIFAGAHSLTTASIFTTGQPLTIAARYILTEPAVDTQYLWQMATNYRLLWRTAAGGRYQFQAASEVTLTASGTGIVDIILSQTASTATLQAAGQQTTVANAGSTGTSLIMGAGSTNPTANGMRGGISRLVVARSALLGTTYESAVRTWLSR